MRTFTQLAIEQRKREIIEIPDEILIKQKTLTDLEQTLERLREERDQRYRDTIQPLEQYIHTAEARIATFDLPPQIEQLRIYIQNEQSILIKLRQTRDGLNAKIKPTEEEIRKLTIAETIKSDSRITRELSTDLIQLKAKKERCLSKLADQKASLHSLEMQLAKVKETNNQEAIARLTDEIRAASNNNLATAKKLSITKNKIESCKNSILNKERQIANNKILLGNYFCFDLLIEANLATARAALTPLLEQLNRTNTEIEAHEANERRFIRDLSDKTSALAKALKDQEPYSHLSRDEARRELTEFNRSITPHYNAQHNTESEIKLTESNIKRRIAYIQELQRRFDDHVNNTFLINYEDNPSLLLTNLKNNICNILNAYKLNHGRLECLEVKRCLYEFETRITFIAGDEEAERNESAQQRRVRLQRLTGYVWSLINRNYKDKSFPDVLRTLLGQSALDELETIAIYLPYKEQSLAYLRDYTDEDILHKEEAAYTEIRESLRRDLAVQAHRNPCEIKLYRAGRELFDIVESSMKTPNANKAYLTNLLIAMHALLLNYKAGSNHNTFSNLAKLNTDGERSPYMMIGGGISFLLGCASAAYLSQAEDASSLPGMLLLAIPIGLGLLIYGRQQGLQQALKTFMQAAESARTNPELQNFGVFNPPAASVVVDESEHNKPSAPPL